MYYYNIKGKYLRYFIYGLLVWFVGYSTIFYYSLDRGSSMSKWVADVYDKKTKIANSIDTPKIIISAGSNALFGIDSNMIEDAFGKPVVNYGVNAGVMLPTILYKTKEILKPNDIVIMPLEYDMYLYDGVPNKQMIDYISSYDSDILYSLSLKEVFAIYYNQSIKDIIKRYTETPKIPKGTYGVHNIDSHGDQIHTEKKYQTKDDLKSVISAKAYKYDKQYSQNSNTLGLEYIKKFGEYCKKNGVILIVTPPSLLQHSVYKEENFFLQVAKVVENIGIIYKGDTYKYMYDKDSFFNTDYHLIDSIRKVRTKQLIDDIKDTLDFLQNSKKLI
jgi:hypothetical protein